MSIKSNWITFQGYGVNEFETNTGLVGGKQTPPTVYVRKEEVASVVYAPGTTINGSDKLERPDRCIIWLKNGKGFMVDQNADSIFRALGEFVD